MNAGNSMSNRKPGGEMSRERDGMFSLFRQFAKHSNASSLNLPIGCIISGAKSLAAMTPLSRSRHNAHGDTTIVLTDSIAINCYAQRLPIAEAR